MTDSVNSSSINNHFRELGLTKAQKLVIHSNLLAFGVVDSHLCSAIFENLFDHGVQALIVPTYTFTDDDGFIFDRMSSKSTNVGYFSEYVRTLPSAVRSSSPIHSHAYVGPELNTFWRSSEAFSFGEGSDFTQMLEDDFWLLMLGTNYAYGCTYIHHLETLNNVPYRKWISVTKKVQRDSGKVEVIRVPYFARMDRSKKNNFAKLDKCEDLNAVSMRAELPYGHSTLIRISDLHRIVSAKLQENPYYLVS